MDEPKFTAIRANDPEMKSAHALASKTIGFFIQKIESNQPGTYMAKLKFRDPDFSTEMGKDQFLYLWLTDVVYHPPEKILSGVFFEVPPSLTKWHQVGQRYGFDPEDVFDWMINDTGKIKGGFTVRVARSRLLTKQEKKYDEYIGADSYEPITQFFE